MLKRIYEEHVLPPFLDVAMQVSVIAGEREKLVPRAHGRVLEIGIGSGLNVPYYDPARVESLYGLDPSAQLERRARLRAARCSFPVEVVEGTAEQIPCEDDSFDTVLSTYTLCSISDLRAALAEMRRVLKPGGQYLFSEHGLSPDTGVAGRQHWLTPGWKHLAGGCHLNVPMAACIRDAGFRIVELSEGYLPGPRPLTYNYRGVAQ